jgi:uncharacterized membrane protein
MKYVSDGNVDCMKEVNMRLSISFYGKYLVTIILYYVIIIIIIIIIGYILEISRLRQIMY